MFSPIARRLTPGRSKLGPQVRVLEGGSCVRVAVRVRPFLEYERAAAHREPRCCAKVVKGGDGDGNLQIVDDKTSRCEVYKVDAFYGGNTTNSELFSKELEPILPSLLQGRNITVLVYGAPGSGKTHAMQGIGKDPGLTSLAISKILSASCTTKFKVEISYCEVYLDRCYDLLDPKGELPVLEKFNGDIQLRGLAEVEVQSTAEFQSLFKEGCRKRKSSSTLSTEASSRTHIVLTVLVTRLDEEGCSRASVGKLNLVDLAGNEDFRKTSNEGLRLAESSRINQSLFALSNVMNALDASEPHIPYRESKLTRILQDSLGRTSRSVMIACLNPGSYTEAAHTLGLAARSRQIVKQSGLPRSLDESFGGNVDMTAKLHAWREARAQAKSSAVLCSPVRKKSAVLQNTSHNRSPRSPALQRILKESSTGISKIRSQAKDVHRRLSPPLKGEVDEANSEMNEQIVNRNSSSNVLSHDTALDAGPDPVSNGSSAFSDVTGAVANKENDYLEPACLLTPMLEQKNNSPLPLSASLLSLTTKLRGALTPLSPSLSNSISGNFLASQIRDNVCFSETEYPYNSSEPVDMDSLPKDSSLTPFERFNNCNTPLRNLLIHEYLEILNTAPREQLLQLKGFGEKRADAIMKLRETSSMPLTELKDLEKIGLSFKQAQTIFNSNVIRQVVFDSEPL